MDCAFLGGTRAFGENGVSSVVSPDLLLATPGSVLDGFGGREPPIEFSRFGGTRKGDGGTGWTGRESPSPDCVRRTIPVGVGGLSIPSCDLDRVKGTLAIGDDGFVVGRRFGRSCSSNNEVNLIDFEFKPSEECDFLKSAFRDGTGIPSPDFDRVNFGLSACCFIKLSDWPRWSPFDDDDEGRRLDSLRVIGGFSDDACFDKSVLSSEALSSSSSSSMSGYVAVLFLMGSNTSLRLHLQQIYNASITIQTQITAITATITMTEPSALLALLVKSFIAFPESLVGVVTPGTTGTGDGASVCMIASISIWKAVISWKYAASILSSELVGLTALYASPSMYAVFFFRISV